jgi:hypothetical protein
LAKRSLVPSGKDGGCGKTRIYQDEKKRENGDYPKIPTQLKNGTRIFPEVIGQKSDAQQKINDEKKAIKNAGQGQNYSQEIESRDIKAKIGEKMIRFLLEFKIFHSLIIPHFGALPNSPKWRKIVTNNQFVTDNG